MPLTRRRFVSTTLASMTVFARSARAAEISFVQYHNQTTASALHRRLVEMWDRIREQTKGRVEARVYPQNGNIAGSDPAALKALVAGEIEFFTLMGGILGTLVPAAEVQQMPYAFRSAAHAHLAMDGALGDYLRDEMTAKGIHGFAVGAFDNGMRQITAKRAIRSPDDLAGLTMRVPAGQLVADTFTALGCQPVLVNSDSIYAALKDGRADAQENPLTLADQFKLYEVVTDVAMTNHMWSGFNLLAHDPTWRRLPEDVRSVIDRNVAAAVRQQRRDQIEANTRLERELGARGLRFTKPDSAPFKRRLTGVYTTWRERLGSRCYGLLERASGTLT